MKVIEDFPAFSIVKLDGKRYKHGDKIAIPMPKIRGGEMWHFFTLGTIEGYAIQNGEDPWEAVDQCERNIKELPGMGHRRYWAIKSSVTISDRPALKQIIPGVMIGSTISLQGKMFRIDPAANQNVDLFALDPYYIPEIQ